MAFRIANLNAVEGPAKTKKKTYPLKLTATGLLMSNLNSLSKRIVYFLVN
jgi:hypothetical protein